MGLFNTPVSTDKRLFLTSDTQSRVTVSGAAPAVEPAPSTALNIQLRSFETFNRTADDATHTDATSGLLKLPDANSVRFEVNGLLLEPDPLFQYVQETVDVLATPWGKSASMTISVPTEVAPDGQGGASAARVLTNASGTDQYINQILAGLDPGVSDFYFSVFLKPLPPATVPDVELWVDFIGSGAPDAPIVSPTISADPNSGWLRYDLFATNPQAANTSVEVRVILKTDGDIAVWGANFTESSYLASYRPRTTGSLVTTGEEHLIYDIAAMGIEPTASQAFTVLWEHIPLGAQGLHAPQIAFAGGDSNGGPLPAAPALYNKALSFGAHPTVSEFKLAISDTTSGSAVDYTHTGTYNWSRYSHQKWAFVVFNDGSQKCRFFANGTFLGETVISPNLTADNYTKFVLPQAALHRRIETLAEALTDDAAISATTIT